MKIAIAKTTTRGAAFAIYQSNTVTVRNTMDEPLTLEEEQLLDEWTNGYITGHRHGRREGVAAGYREAMRLFFKERQ